MKPNLEQLDGRTNYDKWCHVSGRIELQSQCYRYSYPLQSFDNSAIVSQ